MLRHRALLLPALLGTALFAAVPSPASAASLSLPLPGVCIETGTVSIGDCGDDRPRDDDADRDTQRPGDDSLRRRGCENAELRPTEDNLRHIRRATVCLVNKERTKRDRKKVKAHSTLRRAAHRYADEMVDERFFAHVSPSGSTLTDRIERTSYLDSRRIRRWRVGENLAWGQNTRATPVEIVESWMDSKGHRRNILDKRFRELGVGVVLGTPEESIDDGATYVHVFGRRVRGR